MKVKVNVALLPTTRPHSCQSYSDRRRGERDVELATTKLLNFDYHVPVWDGHDYGIVYKVGNRNWDITNPEIWVVEHLIEERFIKDLILEQVRKVEISSQLSRPQIIDIEIEI